MDTFASALSPSELPSPYRKPFLEHLHSSIAEFAELCAPGSSEMSQRMQVVEAVSRCARDAWGDGVLIVPFGSTATGFLLPNSDIDLVALNVTTSCLKPKPSSGSSGSAISSIATAWMNRSADDPLPPLPPAANLDETLTSAQLRRLLYRFAEQWKHMHSKQMRRSNSSQQQQQQQRLQQPLVQVIAHARVPIVKLKHHTGICVDLCINQRSGVYSSHHFLRARQQFPQLAPLVLCVKHLLLCASERAVQTDGVAALIETFKGGLSSFSVQCLVLAHLHWQHSLQRCISMGSSSDEIVHAFASNHTLYQGMGYQLVSFLHFFGWVFDSASDGIRMYEEFVLSHSFSLRQCGGELLQRFWTHTSLCFCLAFSVCSF